jgi:uncharacterized membrane protein YcfT
MLNSVAEYPHWFVVASAALAAAFVLWIILKILKVALWLFFVGVLVVAGASAVWLLVR